MFNFIRYLFDPFEAILSFRNQLRLPFFMEVIISICWDIWSVLNDAMFRQVQPSIQLGERHFKIDFAQVILRATRACVIFMIFFVS